MRHVRIVWVLLALILSVAACRPRPAPGPATAGPASPTAAPAPTMAAPTPTPALPGLGHPVPAGGEPISLDNLPRLQPIWRAQWPMWHRLWPTSEALIGVGVEVMVISPSDLEIRQFFPLPAGTEFPTALAVSGDHRTAAVGTSEGDLWRVDLSRGEIRGEARISESIKALAFLDPQGQRAAVLADGLRIWGADGSVSSPVGVLPQKDYSGQLSPDGRWALAVDNQGVGGLYEVPSGARILSFTVPFTSPWSVALHPEARYAAVAGRDAVVVLRLDPSGGRAETLRRLSRSGVRGMDGSASFLAILSEEGGGTRLQVLRWESGESVVNTLLDRPFFHVRLDETGGRAYLADFNRLEARSLSDGELLGRRAHPMTDFGIPLWEQRAVVLSSKPLGPWDPEVALLDLATGRLRWQRTLKSPVRSAWADPQGRWVAAALKDGGAEFLKLEDGESIGRLELRDITWLGPDGQGRGLIGLRENTVMLWPVEGKAPVWQRALPVPRDLQLIGAVSPQWIAVAPRRGQDTRFGEYNRIWVMDHEGNIRNTLSDRQNFGNIYRLEWFSDHLIVHMLSGSSGYAFIFSIPGGQQVASPRIRSAYDLTSIYWWPDLRMGVVNNLLDELVVFRMEGPSVAMRSLHSEEELWVHDVQRVGNGSLLLAGAQSVRVLRRGEGSLRWRLKREGQLQAFDLNGMQKVWERPVPFSLLWMALSPDDRWVMIGSAEGIVEIWGVR